jgi:hypothetical protein
MLFVVVLLGMTLYYYMCRSWQACWRRGENRSWPSVSVASVLDKSWINTLVRVQRSNKRIKWKEEYLFFRYKTPDPSAQGFSLSCQVTIFLYWSLWMVIVLNKIRYYYQIPSQFNPAFIMMSNFYETQLFGVQASDCEFVSCVWLRNHRGSVPST